MMDTIRAEALLNESHVTDGNVVGDTETICSIKIPLICCAYFITATGLICFQIHYLRLDTKHPSRCLSYKKLYIVQITIYNI